MRGNLRYIASIIIKYIYLQLLHRIKLKVSFMVSIIDYGLCLTGSHAAYKRALHLGRVTIVEEKNNESDKVYGGQWFDLGRQMVWHRSHCGGTSRL